MLDLTGSNPDLQTIESRITRHVTELQEALLQCDTIEERQRCFKNHIAAYNNLPFLKRHMQRVRTLKKEDKSLLSIHMNFYYLSIFLSPDAPDQIDPRPTSNLSVLRAEPLGQMTFLMLEANGFIKKSDGTSIRGATSRLEDSVSQSIYGAVSCLLAAGTEQTILYDTVFRFCIERVSPQQLTDAVRHRENFGSFLMSVKLPVKSCSLIAFRQVAIGCLLPRKVQELFEHFSSYDQEDKWPLFRAKLLELIVVCADSLRSVDMSAQHSFGAELNSLYKRLVATLLLPETDNLPTELASEDQFPKELPHDFSIETMHPYGWFQKMANSQAEVYDPMLRFKLNVLGLNDDACSVETLTPRLEVASEARNPYLLDADTIINHLGTLYAHNNRQEHPVELPDPTEFITKRLGLFKASPEMVSQYIPGDRLAYVLQLALLGKYQLLLEFPNEQTIETIRGQSLIAPCAGAAIIDVVFYLFSTHGQNREDLRHAIYSTMSGVSAHALAETMRYTLVAPKDGDTLPEQSWHPDGQRILLFRESERLSRSLTPYFSSLFQLKSWEQEGVLPQFDLDTSTMTADYAEEFLPYLLAYAEYSRVEEDPRFASFLLLHREVADISAIYFDLANRLLSNASIPLSENQTDHERHRLDCLLSAFVLMRYVRLADVTVERKPVYEYTEKKRARPSDSGSDDCVDGAPEQKEASTAMTQVQQEAAEEKKIFIGDYASILQMIVWLYTKVDATRNCQVLAEAKRMRGFAPILGVSHPEYSEQKLSGVTHCTQVADDLSMLHEQRAMFVEEKHLEEQVDQKKQDIALLEQELAALQKELEAKEENAAEDDVLPEESLQPSIGGW